MKNLDPADENTIAFFDAVVAARRPSMEDPDLVTRINSYRPGLVTAYLAYNVHFAANTLVTAITAGHSNPTKADMLKLYSYKAKIFQKLKLELTTEENDRLINTCQNCTINEVNSFDHILPKDEFPEFAVNPRNLFPSCTQCNGYKSYVWRNAGVGFFLNLFVDVLPIEQYLFADVDMSDGVKIWFTIANPHGIELGLFNVITSHYDRLHLADRFSKNCNDVITELINSILSVKDELSREKIRGVTIGKADRDRQKFGYNYWKAIATIELINSNDFLDYAMEQ